MHDEHNAEAKQRLADHRMELAVWPDAYVEKKSGEPNFSHLGVKKIHHFVAEKLSKPISFEHLGGRKVGHYRSDATEEPAESAQQDYDSSQHDE
jgi:hypothetical protein